MRALLFVPMFLALILSSTSARADQLLCNTPENAAKAVEKLIPGSYVLDFCSLCGDTRIQVVKVEKAEVVQDCGSEVRLTGTVVATSETVFQEGKGAASPGAFKTGQAPFSSAVDLAYLYAETGNGIFEWFGGQIDLDASVNTATIQLPAELAASFGDHPRPSFGAAALPPPDAEAVRRVWHQFYSGQGRPPILVEAKACLEVDTTKGSPTRFQCVKPVKGPVPKGSLVYAWTAWLVPLGDASDDTVVQFEHQGMVRTTKDIALSGKGLRSRIYRGSTLRKTGTWQLAIRRAGKTLKTMTVQVE